MSKRNELFWPSTYHYIKDRFCHVNSCKRDGKCETCPAGELRRYAARDTDRIGELMKALREKDRTIEFLRGHVRGLENQVEGYRATINKLLENGGQHPF